MTVLQQHFPMGRKRDGILVEFPWYDAFQSNKRAVSDNVAYEKASVLFNLAAVCSQQSLANDLATDGGLKGAARHFQVPFCKQAKACITSNATWRIEQHVQHVVAFHHQQSFLYLHAICSNALLVLTGDRSPALSPYLSWAQHIHDASGGLTMSGVAGGCRVLQAFARCGSPPAGSNPFL